MSDDTLCNDHQIGYGPLQPEQLQALSMHFETSKNAVNYRALVQYVLEQSASAEVAHLELQLKRSAYNYALSVALSVQINAAAYRFVVVHSFSATV